MNQNEEPTSIENYTKIRVLGRGSFGEVCLWRNKNKYFAIKKCTADLTTLPTDVAKKLQERWYSEIEMMKNKIQCDSIVKAINVPQTFLDELNKYNITRLPLLVMEYCENGDLRQMLCKIENSNGLKESDCRNVLKCLRNAIKTLHDLNITHRDIKPENIVIQNRNGKNVYKLTDLGYAKHIYRTAENSCVGTPGYYAPEIITSTEYSNRVDYWSSGIIGFEIICGVRPFIPHQTLPKWMLTVKGKPSKVIAITENNRKEFINHEKLFNENQITDSFKYITANWLRVALDSDAKQRGSQFVTPQGKNEPPKLVLKFYSELDKVINVRILKLFSLTNYKFLSYVIDENTTMDELRNKIEKSILLPKDEIYFIIPIDSKVEHIKNDTRPIDFYIEDYNDVMLFITQINKICEKPSGPPISNVVQEILEIKDEKIESFYFKEFIRHVIWMLRAENLYYFTMLNGLENFALNLNDSIEKNQSNKDEMKNKTLIAYTKVNSHIAAVSHTREQLEKRGLIDVAEKYLQDWEIDCNKMQEETNRFMEIHLKVVQRFDSILRRSKKILNSKIFAQKNDDQFEVQKYEKKYQLIRHLKETDRLKDELKEFRDIVYESMRRRRNLLKNIEFTNLQTTLNEIHIEYIKCYSIIINSQIYLQQHESEIQRKVNKYFDEFWQLQDLINQKKSEKLSDCNSKTNSHPDIDALTAFSDNGNNSFQIVDQFINKYGSDALNSMTSCFGEGNNVKSLMEENDQIFGAFDDLVNELTI